MQENGSALNMRALLMLKIARKQIVLLRSEYGVPLENSSHEGFVAFKRREGIISRLSDMKANENKSEFRRIRTH